MKELFQRHQKALKKGYSGKFDGSVTEFFGYNLAGLTAYVDQTSEDLLRATLFDNPTATAFQRIENGKYKRAMNLVNQTLFFQDGDSCGLTATGTTTLTQRELTVGAIQVNQQWCPADFNQFWAQALLKAGSYQEELPAEAVMMEYMVKLIAQTLETADWQGNVLTTSNPNISQYDGIIRIIDAAGTAYALNSASLNTFTRANADTALDNAFVAAPVALKSQQDLEYAVGSDWFAIILQAYYDNNSFGNGVSFEGARRNREIMHPIYGIPIRAYPGLNGTNRFFLLRNENLFLGTDIFDEENDFRLWYSPDDDVVRFRSKFKRGWQTPFPAEIGQFTLA